MALQNFVPFFQETRLLYNEPVNVASFLESWTEMSNFDFAKHRSEDDQIKTMMNLDQRTFDKLSKRCGEKSLLCGKEDQLDLQSFDCLPDDVDLASFKIQKVDLERRNNDQFYKDWVRRTQAKRDIFTQVLCPIEREPPPENRITTPDVCLQIAMYKPKTTRGTFISRKVSNLNLNLENVYAVLGQQTLTEFRDRLRCVNDVLVTGDYSENPDLETGLCAWDVFKSGTFFIEDIFYDDMRQPDNLRYSKEIIEWAAENGTYYEAKTMEDTKFSDLKIRIGCPYLYLHQGNCEHLLVFTDIRMIQPHDILNIREYPLLVHRSTRKRTICYVCAYASARWRTVESEHALESTSFFCDTCFRSLHYDEDGKKLGNFRAYKYFDEHTVL